MSVQHYLYRLFPGLKNEVPDYIHGFELGMRRYGPILLHVHNADMMRGYEDGKASLGDILYHEAVDDQIVEAR